MSMSSTVASSQMSSEFEGLLSTVAMNHLASDRKETKVQSEKEDHGDYMPAIIIVSAILLILTGILVAGVFIIIQQKEHKKKLALAAQLEKEEEERRKEKRKKRAAEIEKAKRRKKEREERRRKQREEDAEMVMKFEDYLKTQMETQIQPGNDEPMPKKSATTAKDDEVLKKMGAMNLAVDLMAKNEEAEEKEGQ